MINEGMKSGEWFSLVRTIFLFQYSTKVKINLPFPTFFCTNIFIYRFMLPDINGANHFGCVLIVFAGRLGFLYLQSLMVEGDVGYTQIVQCGDDFVKRSRARKTEMDATLQERL